MKHLSFKQTGTGSTAWKNYSLYTTVDEPADSDKQVMFKSLSSGTIEVPIDFTSGNPNSSISFITINGKSIIKTGNSDSIGDINVVL
jgi:hypothetical protein